VTIGIVHDRQIHTYRRLQAFEILLAQSCLYSYTIFYTPAFLNIPAQARLKLSPEITVVNLRYDHTKSQPECNYHHHRDLSNVVLYPVGYFQAYKTIFLRESKAYRTCQFNTLHAPFFTSMHRNVYWECYGTHPLLTVYYSLHI
jgi:hypothetical protein